MTEDLNKKILSRLAELSKDSPRHVIGAFYDEPLYGYCLATRQGDNINILLSKIMKDKVKFEQEVENLAKYFNATILEQH